MAHLVVVGDKGSEIHEIAWEILKIAGLGICNDKLRKLARILQISDVKYVMIRHKPRGPVYAVDDALDQIFSMLSIWRGRKSTEATLDKLYEGFLQIEMNAVADGLRSKFGYLVVDPTITPSPESPDVERLTTIQAIKIFNHEVMRLNNGNGSENDQLANQMYFQVPNFREHSGASTAQKPMIIPTIGVRSESPNHPGFSQHSEICVETSPIDAKNGTIKEGGSIKPPESMVHQVGTTNIFYFPTSKRLGQGATSIVYQGYFGNKETPAAIKEVIKNDSNVFEKELDIFMTLMGDPNNYHQNVVKLFLWIEHDDMLYFAMEQASCDLSDFIKTNKTLDEDTIVKISFHTVQGLKFLHDNKILHRDLKPDNILIFEKYDKPLAKLGDFGVSRKMKSITSTVSNSAGTEIWMSPEAITARHKEEPFPNTKALDIFSLGMTIYFTFSRGIHPFAKSKAHGCCPMMNIKDAEILPTKLCEAHDSIFELLSWMMKKTPQDRPNIQQVISSLIWVHKEET